MDARSLRLIVNTDFFFFAWTHGYRNLNSMVAQRWLCLFAFYHNNLPSTKDLHRSQDSFL